MLMQSWLAYLAACLLLTLIPGPSVLMVVGHSLTRSLRSALFCVAGNLIATVSVMSASYLGIGMVLAASSTAFLALKWAGVAYMAYLGIAQILSARTDADAAGPRRDAPAAGSLRAGFLTGVLNPKAIMFYMAFLAQFIDPAAPQLPQILILMATSLAVVAAVLGGYALLAARIGQRLRSVRLRKRLDYTGGCFLLGGSVVMATTR